MKYKEWTAGQRYAMNNEYFEAFHNYTSKELDIAIHSHDFYEALFFVDGNVDFYVEDKIYKMRPGDILLTNSRELHKATVGSGNVYERYVMWFHPSFVSQISEFSAIDASLCFSSATEKHNNLIRSDSYRFEKIISKLKELPIDNELDQKPILPIHKCIAAQILIMINDIYNDNQNCLEDVISNKKINDIVLYINNNLCEDLSLDVLSKKFYVSKYHLTRQFSKYTGLSLHKFILVKRLNNARIMISEGKAPYSAAFESGFNNYSHFSKVFKEVYGITPSDYGAK